MVEHALHGHPVKPRRGRPSLSGETGERYQVTIPPTVAARLRAYGGGSMSAGIIKAAKRIRPSVREDVGR